VRYMSVAGMRELVDAHAPYGPLLFMAIVVAGLFTRVPMMGTMLVAVGAVLFGGLAAFAYGWLAALVGTTAIFVLVRSVARDYAKRMLDARPGRLRALDERITRNGFGTVLVLRLIFGMAPMLNWGFGLTGVHLLHCFAATALGIVPNLAVAVFFADTIANRLPGSGTLLPWVVVGGMHLLPWVVVGGMPALVAVFRAASLLAFAGPMLLNVGGRDRKRSGGAERRHGDRTPVLANFAAFGLFFALMIAFVGSADGPMALLLALCGCLLAVAGSALVIRSRRELGSAWSFVPTVVQGTGLVTTGPYRLVRHPIYLGLVLLTAGEALAFGSWPALIIVLSGIVPTFAWRAHAEEALLSQTFGESYALYQKQVGMITPRLF
jgi:protein-S-isoprenylcysteine O-methyltransferase Ste14